MVHPCPVPEHVGPLCNLSISMLQLGSIVEQKSLLEALEGKAGR